MKTDVTDFAQYLESFFTDYLGAEQGVSKHTIRSYRDTFILLIEYMSDVQGVPVDKLLLVNINRDVILSFLNWLQDKRKNSSSTRNQRFAAIRSFFEFLERKDPTRLATWQSIRSIKFKKTPTSTVNYITIDGIKCLLDQVPTNNRHGRRNLTMLSLLYESGARVQELVDLTPSCLRLDKPALVRLHGKGNKTRIVPLREQQVDILAIYLQENRLNIPSQSERPLFFNSSGSRLTCSGVTYILKLYAAMARAVHPELIPEQISPHSLRHSKAMHLLQAGVNLVYIRYPNKNIILTFKVRYQVFSLITYRKFGLYLDYLPLLNNADSFSLSFPHFCGSDLVFSSSNDIIAFACISIVISRYSIVVVN